MSDLLVITRTLKVSTHGLPRKRRRCRGRPHHTWLHTLVADLNHAHRCSKYSQCFIVGDVNVHLDDKASMHTIRLQQLLADFGLHDCVRQPTHTLNHQLDIFVMRYGCQPSSLQVNPPMLSDHSLIVTKVDTRTSIALPTRPPVRRRRWAAFCIDDFINELNQSQLITDPPTDVDELFASYDKTISDILDKLAPVTEVKQYARCTSPWYDHECYITKLQTRRFERKYRRNPTPTAKSLWRSQFSRQRTMYQLKFTNYWSRKISDSAGNSKQLWSHLRHLLSEPAHTATVHSADDFATHFESKIERIRQSTATFPEPCIPTRCVAAPLSSFRPVTVAEVASMIRKSPAKQCALDPMPTWLLKSVCDTVAPIITMMCNASISQSRFPHCHKSAIVRPILKKTNLDSSDLNSYRPISNLSYVSKLLERIIDSRITEHANLNKLFSPVQSAYRKHHSTETALVKIHNDLVTSIDQGHTGALVLLDMSAAFDTVDHHLLLRILQRRFSINDSALAWFNSYLSDRSQTVHVNNSISRIASLSCGMPQGSSLGPKTFIAYTEDVDNVFSSHQLDHHSFADDIQAYIHTVPSNANTIGPRLQQCISDVADWCGSRRLQLNALKTELMWFGSSAALNSLSQSDMTVNSGADVIQPVTAVRDLGVHLDSELSMRTHISKTTQTCFFHLRRLRQVRRLLGRDVTANLVSAFVLSRLDYGNALLAGLPYATIAPLQRVLNAAVRLVYGLRPRDHVSAAMMELHWLPVEARIHFKLCLLAHHTVIGNAPTYITDLLQPVSSLSSRGPVLRSATRSDFQVPRTRLKFGERAFSVAAAKSWNNLPLHVRSADTTDTFKRRLKTFLFCSFYHLPLPALFI